MRKNLTRNKMTHKKIFAGADKKLYNAAKDFAKKQSKDNIKQKSIVKGVLARSGGKI